MKLAIVGSRSFGDFNLMEKSILDRYEIGNISMIVSGGAKGADALAERFASKYNIKTVIFKAEWNLYGKSAGPRRNTEIINFADEVVAFPSSDSIGTYDSIDKAELACKPLHIINV